MATRTIQAMSAMCLILALAGVRVAEASEASPWRLTPGVFGTLGAVINTRDDVVFRRDVSQPQGSEGGELSFATDSLLGLQLNAGYGEQFEFVAQIVSKLDEDNGWHPGLSRGFLRYVPDEALKLRIGRIPQQLYLRLDSRDVGYSYRTLRPPVDAYGFASNDTLDGADLVWSRPWKDALWNLTLYGGRSKFVTSEQADVPDLLAGGVIVDLYYRDWQFRLGGTLVSTQGEDPVNPVVEPLRDTGEPQAMRLAELLADPGDHYNQMLVAVVYDRGPLLFEVLAQRIINNKAFGVAFDSGYATLGYQLGKFAPYVSFALMDSHNDLIATGLNDPAYAEIDQAARTAQVRAGYVSDQHTTSLGLRYDLAQHFDLKLQLDQVWVDNSQLVIDQRAKPTSGFDMTVIGLALDFAF